MWSKRISKKVLDPLDPPVPSVYGSQVGASFWCAPQVGKRALSIQAHITIQISEIIAVGYVRPG